MSTIYVRNSIDTSHEEVSDLNPFPTRSILESTQRLFNRNIPLSADISWTLALEGRLFIAADADQNDRVTGQTSLSATTATFVLDNPVTSGVICLFSRMRLSQTGTVAGGDIFVEVEGVSPSIFSSGTTEKAVSGGFGMPNPPDEKCTLYSTVTTAGTYGIKLYHFTLGPDVSPAEGVINNPEYVPPAGLFFWPSSSLKVSTYAGTTGPTWDWGFEWYELPVTWLT